MRPRLYESLSATGGQRDPDEKKLTARFFVLCDSLFERKVPTRRSLRGHVQSVETRDEWYRFFSEDTFPVPTYIAILTRALLLLHCRLRCMLWKQEGL